MENSIRISFQCIEMGSLFLCMEAYWFQIGYMGPGMSDFTAESIGKPVGSLGWSIFIITLIAVILLCGRTIIITKKMVEVRYSFGLFSRTYPWEKFQYSGVLVVDKNVGLDDGNGFIYFSSRIKPKHWWTVFLRTVWFSYSPSLWSVVERFTPAAIQIVPANWKQNDGCRCSDEIEDSTQGQLFEQVRLGISTLYFVCALCIMLTENLYVILPIGLITGLTILFHMLILRPKIKNEYEMRYRKFLRNL
jgi:hypothetical protein